MRTPRDVVDFWRAAGPGRWFTKDEAFDAALRERFLALHEQAAAGALAGWLQDAEGALALAILLDQFPRNAFRGTARVYATDAAARAVTQRALAAGWDAQIEPPLRQFLYLPLMHSENAADHAQLAPLAEALGGEHARYARHHRDIIERFGRFPHRNALLGRTSTPQEERFLAEGGFAG